MSILLIYAHQKKTNFKKICIAALLQNTKKLLFDIQFRIMIYFISFRIQKQRVVLYFPQL